MWNTTYNCISKTITMKLYQLSLLIAGTMMLHACSNNSGHEKLSSEIRLDEIATDKNDFEQQVADTSAPVRNVAPKMETTRQEEHIDWDKKIIKTADVNLEVKDFALFSKQVKEKTRRFGGYTAEEKQEQTDYKIETALVIKVPVQLFDDAITDLMTGAEKINEKTITSNDVTAEYFDTRSRTEAKKQVRLRYLDLLRQAKNMEEILNVQSQINSIQEDIESAEGRLQYLGHASSYSTINLRFYQVLNVSAKDDAKPTFAAKLSQAFHSGWNWVGDFFIGLVSVWPLFLIIFSAIILYKRFRTQRIKQA